MFSSATVATSAIFCCTSRSRGCDDVAVAVGDRDQQRRDRERDQRELPRDHEDHDADPDDREDVLEEEDQPVAEEEADALQVDGRAAHQLAGLVAVVEAEGEPDELRVERRRACPARRAAPACRRSAGGPTSSARVPRRARRRSRRSQRQLAQLVVAERADDAARRAGSRASAAPASRPPARSRRSVDALYGRRKATSRRNVERERGEVAVVHGLRVAGPSLPRRASSAWTSATASATRARFAGAFSQLLAPEGCGSGIATAPSSS